MLDKKLGNQSHAPAVGMAAYDGGRSSLWNNLSPPGSIDADLERLNEGGDILQMWYVNTLRMYNHIP